MKFKTKLGAATVGILTVGGSIVGISLTSGAASPAPSTGAVSASAQADASEATDSGDPGPAVQSGPQSGQDSMGPDPADGVATETTTPETGAPSDGPGGHQDPAGNVDNQSTTEQ